MRRELRMLLEETPGGRAYLARLDADKRAHSRRTAPKRAERVKAKEGKRATKRDETYLLRIHAFEKWGGRCVLCMGMLEQDWHLHHIVGAGLRRSRQSKANTVPLCAHDHRRVHANDVLALLGLRAWAETNADEFTKAELERRIAKIQEARRCATK